jgi:hypothetical protein
MDEHLWMDVGQKLTSDGTVMDDDYDGRRHTTTTTDNDGDER